jgi:hypothetical protein
MSDTVFQVERDLLRDTLRSSLRHSFLTAGYEDEEACKLVEIAIGPIHQVLELAHAAYKLHIEAIESRPAGEHRKVGR